MRLGRVGRSPFAGYPHVLFAAAGRKKNMRTWQWQTVWKPYGGRVKTIRRSCGGRSEPRPTSSAPRHVTQLMSQQRPGVPARRQSLLSGRPASPLMKPACTCSERESFLHPATRVRTQIYFSAGHRWVVSTRATTYRTADLAAAATSDRHAARVVFQNVSDPSAESARFPAPEG
jgi:hypothetical protein